MAEKKTSPLSCCWLSAGGEVDDEEAAGVRVLEGVDGSSSSDTDTRVSGERVDTTVISYWSLNSRKKWLAMEFSCCLRACVCLCVREHELGQGGRQATASSSRRREEEERGGRGEKGGGKRRRGKSNNKRRPSAKSSLPCVPLP